MGNYLCVDSICNNTGEKSEQIESTDRDVFNKDIKYVENRE